ncbi:MAG: DMT family transporter, partial [Candidatus Poribacteria bacterium]
HLDDKGEPKLNFNIENYLRANIRMRTPKNQAMPVERASAKIIALVLLLALFWGANTVFLKISLRDIPPLAVAGFRFLTGMLVIFFWAASHRIPLMPQKGEFFPLLSLSAIFTMQIGLFNLGTKFTYAAHATILINTHPFFTAAMAHFFIPGDELNIRKILGLVVAFSGVLIIFRGNIDLQLSYLLGDLLVLSSGFLLGLLNVLTKRLVQYINSYRLLTWEMLLSLPLFFGLSLFLEGIENYHFSHSALSAILYQGLVVGGFCFVAWTLILRRHSPSKLSVLFFATPLFGVLLSIIFLHEPMSWNLAFGAVFVAVGIYIVNRV